MPPQIAPRQPEQPGARLAGAWFAGDAGRAVLESEDAIVREATAFLSHFGLDEIDEEIAQRAAALRRDRPRLKSPDAIILATAQIRGRVLVTRNIKDFPAAMPGIRVPYTL